MAKRYYQQRDVPTAKELEAALEVALHIQDNVTPALKTLQTSIAGWRGPKVARSSVIAVRVDAATQRTHVQFPCGEGARWFSAEHGERHIQTQIHTLIAEHG